MKKYYIGTKTDGAKDVIYNWPRNINSEIYPEYQSWAGPFDSKDQAASSLKSVNAGH